MVWKLEKLGFKPRKAKLDIKSLFNCESNDIMPNFLLEIKESLLIKCDQPVLNKNISFATLHLFETV